MHCKQDGCVIEHAEPDQTRCADCRALMRRSCALPNGDKHLCHDCAHAAQVKAEESSLVELRLTHCLEDLRASREGLDRGLSREQLARLVPIIRSICDESEPYARALGTKVSEAYATPLPGIAA